MAIQPEPLITIAEVAKLLGVSRYRTNQLIAGGYLTPIQRPGLKYPYFRTSEVQACKVKINQAGGAIE